MVTNEGMEKEKQLKRLETSYQMYENTKKRTIREMKHAVNNDGTKKYPDEIIDEKIKELTLEQDFIIKQYIQAGGDENTLNKLKTKKAINNSNNIDKLIEENMLITSKRKIEEDYNNIINEYDVMETKTTKKDKKEKSILQDIDINHVDKIDTLPQKEEYNSEMAFDVIPLPSKGECYKHKIGNVSVSYLNAYDENMIVSPNLYRDNLILDYLLKEKVLNKDIDTMSLTEGDREAIILYLRSSGYGVEYPITATDPTTGIEFETVIDLSKLKYKDFKLKGDVNGWFDYTLPVSKKVVKFRFLTHRDNLNLDRISQMENKKLMKDKISDCVNTLDIFIENDTTVDASEKIRIRQAIRTLEKWQDNLDDDTLLYNHDITNRLILSIMSIDGNEDRTYISDYVKKMCVKDSSSLRKYITKNEPGVNYELTIEKPESLGGGSMTVFLQFDQFIFLNITE